MNLPKHVYPVKDRHGKTRYRFLKKGLRSAYLPDPAAPEFGDAYQACFDPDRPAKRVPRPKRRLRRSWAGFRGKSVVYFVGFKGLVKIGRTVNLPDRIKKLQTAVPARLKILAVVDGGRDEEAAYHVRFADLRRHGEWFEKGPELAAEIARISGGGFHPQSFQPLGLAKSEGNSDDC